MTHPKIGVGVIVLRNGKVLIHQRKGDHGNGTWAFPGGHLEFGETPEQTAAREVLEESGLVLKNIKAAPYTNDVFSPDKHYITLYFVAEADGEPKNTEPHKCSDWEWHTWDQLPEPLFLPIVNLRKKGFNPHI